MPDVRAWKPLNKSAYTLKPLPQRAPITTTQIAPDGDG